MFDIAQILSETDCRKRTAPEFVKWVRERFNVLARTPEGEGTIQLREPRAAKLFMEEVYPLHRLIQHRFPTCHDVFVLPEFGTCKNYDAVILNGFPSLPEAKIEITVATDEEDYQRMVILQRDGQVAATGPIVRKRTKGKRIEIKAPMKAVSYGSVFGRIKRLIRMVLVKKCCKKNRYGTDTILLIAFYDDPRFCERHVEKLRDFVNSLLVSTRMAFRGVFLVSYSGRYLLEFTQQTYLRTPNGNGDYEYE